jgi:hypothetical protein
MLAIPWQCSSLEFLNPIKWTDIFSSWKKGEAWQKSWKKHWKERGFSSWDKWREDYVKPLEPQKLEWFLYDIKNPLQEFPLFYGVPSRSWIEKAYGGEKTKQLKEIINLPIIKDNLKVLDIKKDFPKETMFTGIIHEDRIVLIEGMHRASALASWDKNKPLNSKVKIALAYWKPEELPILGGAKISKS